MAATESPLVNSPANMMSAFSPYTEFSLSPNSPAPPNTPGRFQSLSARSSADASSLRPKSMEGDDGFLSPNIAPSPSDMVGPSPVTSTGTESTDIEDDASEEIESSESATSATNTAEEERPISSRLNSLTTNLAEEYHKPAEDEPASVIHAPQGYMNFANAKNTNPPQIPPAIDRSTPKPFQTIPPSGLRIEYHPAGDKTMVPSPVSPPPISTDVRPVSFGIDNVTPRAQTWHEVEIAKDEKIRHRSSSASSLEGIPEDYRESDEGADFSDAFPPPPQSPSNEVDALKTALHECWTLCNTLARMSSIHRERIFSYSGTKDAHEKAWKSCWRLCQKLYDSRDDHQELHVSQTLDLCRDFCQALFDVRRRGTEIADGVLRVSFELNNHLFNTHDRNLPDAFRERTLDFYITLCHRLMKQRSELAEETDSLLRACWGLAEMLFSLRQNRREDKVADEELLGSAVQACWELCDLFREGWTQVRPERGTPRPSQTTFSQSFDQLSRSSHHSSNQNSHQSYSQHNSHGGHSQGNSISSLPHHLERVKPRPIEPETPTTEFEDTPISPEETSPTIPNILVLGTSSDSSRSQTRWSSNSSNLSGYSQGSAKTSSTIKTSGGIEDVNLTRLKTLILKAAMNVGFQRSTGSSGASPPPNQASALQAFVKGLPANAFGKLLWHANLLVSYKELVASDPTFRSAGTLPAVGKRVSAVDMSKSVGWMIKGPGSGMGGAAKGKGDFKWLADLYRLVFGFSVEDGEAKKGTGITV